MVALEEGRLVHQQIIQCGFESNVFVGNSLVDMYAKCGSMKDALRVFDKMPSRDVVSWNALLLGLVKCGQAHKALEFFQQMQREGVKPGPVTFMAILNACGLQSPSMMAGMLMNRLYRAVTIPMSLWALALWTCKPNVGAWRMLGECSRRCPHMMWSLGML